MNVNKFDIFILLLSTCTCFGLIGGAFQVDRVLAILLIPWLINNMSKQGYSYAKQLLKDLEQLAQ